MHWKLNWDRVKEGKEDDEGRKRRRDSLRQTSV
jgi:hypothetical protein